MRCSRGLSLLEVVFGCLIFSVVFTGLAASWFYYERGVQKYRSRNLARFVAQNQIESVQAAGFDKLQDADFLNTVNAESEVIFTRKIDGVPTKEIYQQQVEVREHLLPGQSAGEGDLVILLVTVTYPESGERTGKFALETAVYRNE